MQSFRSFLMAASAAICIIAQAEIKTISAGSDLQQAIDTAQVGDELHLAAGDYHGNIVVNQSISLIGSEKGVSHIIGDGKADAIRVTAENVHLAHLTVSGSGKSLSKMNAGIFLDKTAHHAVVKNNHIQGNLFGVYVWGPDAALVENNVIRNDNRLRVNSRGNGVSIWRSPKTIIKDNDISGGRDGIFTNVSKDNLFIGNYLHDLRFAVHYMYTEDSEVRENRADNVESAYVLMFSNRISAVNNVTKNSKEHGLMLNDVNHSVIRGNTVNNAKKCVFLYNANHNEFDHNYFQGCEIGIHSSAGSENNGMHDNSFVQNQTQVMYVGTRESQWSHEGRGNYWSDHSAFDLNGDGIADTPYRPNTVMDQILWRAPSAKLLINSPAAQLLKYAQQQFPSLLPGGVTDTYPLMQPTPTEHSHEFHSH
ncbi:nitrous oxide reductase family maturation protein NosD [Suttonella ornithocola]|uniref:Nitrous oxide reductase family maturation protein NosD n=1 Tax=Suttonella ornithocola TaxID=279832 RepID=A0A380MR01_9GAMM|nr:nitrous oxide reductase family maturation protein NosD [Suttonella ornithocola]SUO94486.1 nitrous oxide reductase family maturation protein NosD [Suttonella ornithocola]